MDNSFAPISHRSFGNGESALRQLLLDALPVPALLIDHEGKISAANAHAERLLGWTLTALEGKPAHELLRCRMEESDGAGEQCPIEEALTSERFDAHGRMWVQCRGRGAKPVEYRCTVDPAAARMGLIVAFTDLTLQTELERDLRCLASVAEASPIAIVVLNEDANLIHANPAMMSLMDRFGFGADVRPVVLPANLESLVHDCLRQQCASSGTETHFADCCFEWKFVPVSGERKVRGYGVDVSERKQAERKLLQAKVAAEAANIAKSQFLANVSKELRTPLNGIIGMAELLAEGELTPRQVEYTRTLRSCADALVLVIEEILDMAALETSNTAVEKTAFHLRDFISQTAAPWRRRANEKGLNFKITIADSAPEVVLGDRQRLKQVFGRLIGNAIKFTEQGQVEVAVERRNVPTRSDREAAKGADGEADRLVFYIRDTGIGISLQQQSIIFDLFSQADSASRYGGTGLGLAISKQLVEMMGGVIGVESEQGKGSSVWVSLPLEADRHQPANGAALSVPHVALR